MKAVFSLLILTGALYTGSASALFNEVTGREEAYDVYSFEDDVVGMAASLEEAKSIQRQSLIDALGLRTDIENPRIRGMSDDNVLSDEIDIIEEFLGLMNIHAGRQNLRSEAISDINFMLRNSPALQSYFAGNNTVTYNAGNEPSIDPRSFPRDSIPTLEDVMRNFCTVKGFDLEQFKVRESELFQG